MTDPQNDLLTEAALSVQGTRAQHVGDKMYPNRCPACHFSRLPCDPLIDADLIERLAARVRALEEDGKRLDWLEEQVGVAVGRVTVATPVRDYNTGEHLETEVVALVLLDYEGIAVPETERKAETVRAAIDAALSKEPTNG